MCTLLEGTVIKNTERLALHKRRAENAGFRRISMWVSGELAEMLAREIRQGECGGRILERLLLGEAAKRPGAICMRKSNGGYSGRQVGSAWRHVLIQFATALRRVLGVCAAEGLI